MDPLTFRPVVPAEDDPFLLELYGSTRTAELAQVPWTDAQRQAFLHMQYTAQQAHYRSHYPESEHRMILCGGQLAGRLWSDRTAERIHIIDLTVAPAFRDAGVEMAVLRELMAEAGDSGRALRIYIESFNPSLVQFEQLGFTQTAVNGAHVLLEWRADRKSDR